jgi:polyketide cyclase/dehydrase/lipid transport protein
MANGRLRGLTRFTRTRARRRAPGPSGSAPEVRRATAAGADAVWVVLTDGWRLSTWVVGAARVDAVDPGWPTVGSRLRYCIGGWPLMLPGSAEVTVSRPGRELALHGRTPFGGIDVQVLVDPAPAGCVLIMREDVVSGLARLVPGPARAVAIRARNVETLRRLALLTETPAG